MRRTRVPGAQAYAAGLLVCTMLGALLAHATVLSAMGAIERHRFVDTALVNQAYEDTSLPIGLGQTISKPGVVARMLERPTICISLCSSRLMT